MSGFEEFDYQIAVIGMAGRFPGASDIDRFWQNLRDGVEAITRFSDEELQALGVGAGLLGDPNYVKAAAILDDVESFDAPFFGFNPREAEIMDPQHRILLEQAWAAVENAGYDPDRYEGRIGVYAGASSNTYLINNLLSNPKLLEAVGPFQAAIGNDRDFLATQIAYKLNLKGPSLTVQTACSTSLVAIHLACQSLLNRECDMALAGGVSIRVPQKQGYLYEQGSILSPDGHCRAFDARAQGTLSGSGAGVVVLKRLADALSDGDTIHAVIKGSAANNDGSLKVGYTAPSIEGQSAVIEEALSMAMIEAETITYIEAHGTATPLGDPVEIAALTQAFRKSTDKKGFCAVGSVKINIGHLDAAAGVASFIKTILALNRKMLPPSLHYETPNPQINFADSPFYVNDRLSVWGTGATPRRAGVSSFGIGGTNAHIIVEEAPAVAPAESSKPHHLIVLSAKTGSGLETATARLAAHLKENASINLADVAYTLQTGRRGFSHRRAFVCRSVGDAVNALESLSPTTIFTGYQEMMKRPVAFTFSGQGTQYVNMSRGLYEAEPNETEPNEAEPIFRAQVDLCSEALKPLLGFDLRSALYPSKEEAEQAALRLSQTIAAQPALFVIEYALAKLLEQWGIAPKAMCGHSIGEYVAACLAGVFSLSDALSLVATRGQLMQQLPGGAMLAVPLAESALRPLLETDSRLSLAAINAPSLSIISGPEDSVKRLHHHLNGDGLACRYLQTSHAFHSAMMEPILEAFTEKVKRVRLHPPNIPYISNLTGTWITDAEATSPDYWAKHLRQTVCFSDGIMTLLGDPDILLLEIGPGQITGVTLKQYQGKQYQGKQYQGGERIALSTLRRPGDERSDLAFLLNTVGHLWLAGAEIDWAGFHANERRTRIPLPTYPFERQRYWVEPQQQGTDGEHDKHERPNMADWFYIPSWKRSPLPAYPAREEETDDLKCWLVFDDGAGLGVQVIKNLERQGAHVVKVSAGESFAGITERAFVINPRSEEDYKKLLREVRALDRVPENILHLWNVTSSASAAPRGESFEDSQYMGFYSLIFLAQALGDQYLTVPVQIGVASTNLQEVTGEEVLRPEKATLLGPCKVIPLEYNNVACRSIDITLSQSEDQPTARLAETLIAEMLRKSSDSVVAYRGKHRWVQVFEHLRLDEEVGRSARLRQGGVYLLTGGLGELELELARYFAQAAQARLVLIDNADFPEREDWQRWLETHELETHEEDSTSGKINRLLALEQLGAQAIVVRADITSPEQVRSVVGRALQAFGAIHGVVHTAAAVGGGMIQFKKPDMAESVLAPKVKGTLALDAALADVPLDFIALFSSTLSITGVFGQVDYCGANAFLGAFARSSSSRRAALTVSITWNTPEWEAWQEEAMLAVPEVQAEFNRAKEMYGINYSEGMEAFARVIDGTQPEVIVAARDFQAVIEEQASSAASGLMNMLENVGRAEHKPARPELDTAYAAPANETEQLTADIWQDVFGIERVGIHDDFFSLGGNSLLAIQLVSRLRKTFKVEIPLSKLFEFPTVAGLSATIAENQVKQKDLEEMERLLREIEAMSPESVQVELEVIQSSNEEKVNG